MTVYTLLQLKEVSSMCSICDRADRVAIENAILTMTESERKRSIDDIAKEYACNITDLKAHALFHTPGICLSEIETPAVADTDPTQSAKDNIAPRNSLVRKLKLRESDILSEVNNEYMLTLKNLGRRINKLTSSPGKNQDEDDEIRCSKLLTKPMVELYIGLGGELRQNIKTIADIDRMLNGPEDSTGTGLLALATAIRSSGEPHD